MEHPDFVEGVSAKLIRRPAETPVWQPASLDEVSDADVEAFFTDEPTLQLLTTGDAAAYTSYPYGYIGLPREADVAAVIREGESRDKESVIQHFLEQKAHKAGVREKVEEILNRKTEARNGLLVWV